MSTPLENLINTLNKKFGKNILYKGSDPKFKISRIPTGSYAIDYITSGGIAQGRITEIYGNYSTGKTRIALRVMANVMKKVTEKIGVYVSVEDTFDEKYAKKNGVPLDRLIVFRPEVGEDVVNFIYDLLKNDAVCAIVIDSIAALLPSAEANNAAEKDQMGLAGKMTSKLFRKLNAGNTNGCTIIVLNQTRDKIGVMFGKRETTPGGRAASFFASQRFELRKGETLKTVKGKEGVPIGRRIHVLLEKDKTNPNEQSSATFDYYFKKMRVDNEQELVDLGRLTGVLEINRGIIKYVGTDYGTVASFKTLLSQQPKMKKILWHKILSKNKNVEAKREETKNVHNAGNSKPSVPQNNRKDSGRRRRSKPSK